MCHIQLAGGVGAPQVRPPRIFMQYDVDPVLVKQFLGAGKHQRGGTGDGDITDGDIQNGVWAIYGGEVDPQEEAMPANDTPATAAADARRNARLVRGGCGWLGVMEPRGCCVDAVYKK